MATYHPGDYFGEYALLGSDPNGMLPLSQRNSPPSEICLRICHPPPPEKNKVRRGCEFWAYPISLGQSWVSTGTGFGDFLDIDRVCGKLTEPEKAVQKVAKNGSTDGR